ncbi:MAG: polyisoprenoid-binding protein [Betaproteobacteria bacterium]|nr:polyisoprenoid-binding protein [Betaproteobacteria bacterium]
MKCIRQIVLALSATLSLAAIAAPETYVLEGSHTFPRFEYNHFGYSIQSSRFDKTTGKIVIDRAAKTGSADVSIDVKSVNTGSDKLNEHLKSDDFFNAEKFPVITFKSSSFKFEGDKLAAINGNLTIKGITKPVTLAVSSFLCMQHPISKKDACGANASTKIKRTDFDAGKYAPYVGDEVTLNIAVEALKE